MKRAIFLYSLMIVCMMANRVFVAASRASLDQTKAQADAKKGCSFSIVGLWRSNETAETRLFFDFSPEGHVTLLSHSASALPQDFEMVEAVNYKLDKPGGTPKKIEFIATRGNDAFQQGITEWKIVQFSENSFTTQDPASGQKTQWTREQTRRYFLTFAARKGTMPNGGPAFAMWSVLDGRNTNVEALGVQLVNDDAGKPGPVFAAIPEEIYTPIVEERDKNKKGVKDDSVFMRIELNQAEFERTHKLYEEWGKQVKENKLPNADPYINGMEFLRKVAQSINECEEKLKLRSLTSNERDEIVSKHTIAQFLLEYISGMKKNNTDLHVDNAVFPWGWRPMIQMQGQ